MPNKTVYVSDDDLPLFVRAQELAGGNLSAAIVAALRRFIEIEQSRQEGYEDVIVRVGPGGSRKKRFQGMLLGEWRESTADGMVTEVFRVYCGRSGKFALHTQRADWNEIFENGGNWATGLTDWRTMLGIGSPNWGNFTLQILNSLDELKARVPDKLYHLVADVLAHPGIEELDF